MFFTNHTRRISQYMIKLFSLYLIGCVAVILFSLATGKIFFPSDNLYLFPAFSLSEWLSPGNSLLIDPVFQFEPWRHFAKEQILAGKLPFWNDLSGKGVPFLANPQTAVFYPINILYYAFPYWLSLNLIPFTKVFLFGLFSYMYFQSLKFSDTTTLIGVLAASSSAFVIMWLLWPHTNVFIFLPLLLFITERIFSTKRTIHRWYALLSVVYLFAALGGHPGTLLQLLLFHSLYSGFRLKGKLRKLLGVGLFSVLGITLGSFQLLPFLEYLQHSRAVMLRNTTEDAFFLPLQSIIVHVIPFLSGAPHLPFYKSFTPMTNFQEVAGGYIGVSLFISAVLSAVKLWHVPHVRFYAAAVVVFWLIIYKIWPFWYLSQLPGVSMAGSNRLIAFTGFSLLVLALFGIEELQKNKKLAHMMVKIILTLSFFAGGIVTVGFVLVNYFFPASFSPKIQAFGQFLFLHVLISFVTTVLFFLILSKVGKNMITTKMIFVLLVFSQSLLLFWNYTPITSRSEYYPQVALVEKLTSLPRGTYLEVGNLNLPPNVNLIYGLSNAENDDAMQLREYKASFDKAFPVRNRLNVVDTVSLESLQLFGIQYVISDYNLNLARYPLQTKALTYSSSITRENTLSHDFTAPAVALRGIRVFTANFNRHNTCVLHFIVFEKRTKQEVGSEKVLCSSVRDNAFHTIPFKIPLQKGVVYSLRVSGNTQDPENAVALWTDEKKRPYAELFFADNSQRIYRQLWEKNGVSVWEVPNAGDILFDGKYSVLERSPERLSLDTQSREGGVLEIKQPYYPGWQAEIDGKATEVARGNTFTKIYVPEGEHVVTLTYRPLIFLIGFVLSLLVFIGIGFYFIRFERRTKEWKMLCQRFRHFISRAESNTQWWEHVLAVGGGVLGATALYAGIMRLWNLQFSVPQTTAINWLTANKYPKQQDYFYFMTGVPFVICISIAVWVIFLWKKSRS